MESARKHSQQCLIIIHQETLVAVRRPVPRFPIVGFAVGAKSLEASLFISFEQRETAWRRRRRAGPSWYKASKSEIGKGPRGAAILVDLEPSEPSAFHRHPG